jgi:hypothetical protein
MDKGFRIATIRNPREEPVVKAPTPTPSPGPTRPQGRPIRQEPWPDADEPSEGDDAEPA